MDINIWRWTVEVPAEPEHRAEWPTRELAEEHVKQAAAEYGAALLIGPRGFREIFFAEGLAQRARASALEMLDGGLALGDALHELVRGVDFLAGLGAEEVGRALQL